jgi:hypothetical protein
MRQSWPKRFSRGAKRQEAEIWNGALNRYISCSFSYCNIPEFFFQYGESRHAADTASGFPL